MYTVLKFTLMVEWFNSKRNILKQKNMKTNFIKKSLSIISAVVMVTIIMSFTLIKEPSAVINADKEILTVINVITPKEGQQEKIVQLLQKGMTETMSYQKGFISATIHKSLDNDYVIVYAQWKDSASLQNAVELIQTGKAPNMLEVFSNSNPDYHTYDVISVNLKNKKR